MEALEPGKPLSFLDHHIQCGNSLLGRHAGAAGARASPTTPSSPSRATTRRCARELRKQNKKERAGQIESVRARL